MQICRFFAIFALGVALTAFSCIPAGAVIITEFQAVNDLTAPDSYGEFSDWIELYNDGSESVDLDGWFLTDNDSQLDKWRFPAVTILPGEILVVWASGFDKTDPAAELHTNFRLADDGEYLALVTPDMRPV
ncbi:MAG: lamin tail domain-containing protein, partial [Planctomycetes bacterium]|nr:lamin tail domain-containing protein [Planctomycetota bacterium]